MKYKDFLPQLIKLYRPANKYQEGVMFESFKIFCREMMESKTVRVWHLWELINKSPRSWRRTWGRVKVIPANKLMPFRQYKSDLRKHFEKHNRVMSKLLKNVNLSGREAGE